MMECFAHLNRGEGTQAGMGKKGEIYGGKVDTVKPLGSNEISLSTWEAVEPSPELQLSSLRTCEG